MQPVTTLGVDVGGTHARAAVVNSEGIVLGSTRVVLEDRSPEAVIESIVRATREAIDQAGQGTIAACGVGVAAQLEGDTGIVAVAPNLEWRNVPFGPMLSARLKCPVHVVNDLAAAAWGEFRVGAGKGVQDLYVVFVGSGVGSAIISRGRRVTGATGVAGELGHTKVVPNGRLCGCGELGCLEAYVGGRHLVLLAREALEKGQGRKLLEFAEGDVGNLTPEVIERAAMAGDEAASHIHRHAGELLGLALANQVTVLNPARLILGGGVLANCPQLFALAVEGVERYTLRASLRALKVVPAELGDDSGPIGAALLAQP